MSGRIGRGYLSRGGGGIPSPTRIVPHFVQICGEKQEGSQRGRSYGVPLGEGLGGITDGVQTVCLDSYFVRLLAHLDDATGVVSYRSERIHGQDIGSRAKHAHGGDGGAEQ